jgi:hypothetical protein
MSVWRQKAIDVAPELKKDFEDPDRFTACLDKVGKFSVPENSY